MTMQKLTFRLIWLGEPTKARANQGGGMIDIGQSRALASQMLLAHNVEKSAIALPTIGQSRREMNANAIKI